MQKVLCLDAELGLPPSSNILFQTGMKGNKRWTYLSTQGREYRRKSIAALKKYNYEKISSNHIIHIDIEFIFNTQKKQDVDNRIKGLLDSLTRAEVWHDDSQIYKLSATKIVNHKTHACTKFKVYKYCD